MRQHGRNTAWLLLLCAVQASAISFTFHQKTDAACKPEGELIDFLGNSKLQYDLTKDWIRTHEVFNWKASKPILVSRPEDFPEISKHSIPIAPTNGKEKMYYIVTEYDSTVKLPSILRPIMNNVIKTHTVKKSFIMGGREFKVIEITGIPMISKIHIFSKTIMYPNGVMVSKSNAVTGHVPWYADWAKGHIKKEISSSANDYQKRLAKSMCD